MEISPVLSEQFRVPVYLKLEFLQTTGSFKLRGAFFSLLNTTPEIRAKGVGTCSAGNHGWALAFAGKQLGIPITVYLPKSVDYSKQAGIESLGAETIITDSPGYDEAHEFAVYDCRRRGLPFVSAFDDPKIMAANGGSLALEILEQQPDISTFVFPVGGGGLAAGLGVLVKERNQKNYLIGCQHVASPGLKLSLDKGTAITKLPPIKTVAGGIEGGIGAWTFPYIQKTIDQVVLLSESEIQKGLLWLLDHHHYLIEPSSAVALSALSCHKVERLTGPTVIVLTGRNVAFPTLQKIVAENFSD